MSTPSAKGNPTNPFVILLAALLVSASVLLVASPYGLGGAKTVTKTETSTSTTLTSSISTSTQEVTATETSTSTYTTTVIESTTVEIASVCPGALLKGQVIPIPKIPAFSVFVNYTGPWLAIAVIINLNDNATVYSQCYVANGPGSIGHQDTHFVSANESMKMTVMKLDDSNNTMYVRPQFQECAPPNSGLVCPAATTNLPYGSVIVSGDGEIF